MATNSSNRVEEQPGVERFIYDTFEIATQEKGMVKVVGYKYGETGLAYRPCCNGFYVGTHLKTGTKLGNAHFTKSNAEGFVKGLAKLPLDWNQETPDTKPFLDKIHNLIIKHQVFTNWNH